MDAQEFAEEIVATVLLSFGQGVTTATVPTAGVKRSVARAAVQLVDRDHPDWTVSLSDSAVSVTHKRHLN